MPTSEKVATPATALTVVVPTVVPLPLTVMVTKAVLLVTVLPNASLMVIMGWVVNAEPLAEPAAGVVIVAWVAVPKTLATWTALPLVPPKEVTTAVRLPVALGCVLKVMVNWVAVALETVPTAPLLKVTVLLAAVVSNPVPAMVRVVALMARLLVFKVTVGAIFAVCPMKAMLFKSTPALSAPLFAVMMSSLPSPFTSPKVTVVGPDPVAKAA